MAIEFRADGTYEYLLGSFKSTGKYKLEKTTLKFTADRGGTTMIWDNLSAKDGKLLHGMRGVGGDTTQEWKRVIEKK
jgi:hypothetical protein